MASKKKNETKLKSRPAKKKKVESTLLISIDEEDSVFPCQYIPGKYDWEEFGVMICQKANLKEDFNGLCLKFTQKFGGKEYQVHLTENTFEYFNKYVKKCQCGSTEGSAIFLNVFTSPSKSMTSVIVSKPNQSKTSKGESASSNGTNSIDSTVSAFEEMDWDPKYCCTFDAKIRAKVFRKLLENSFESNACCTCKKHHQVKCFQVSKTPDIKKLKALVTTTEMRCLFEKRSIISLIYGNGNLLLNVLIVQCPICGNIISLGHFNDIGHKKDNLYEHIYSSHYHDPIRSTERAAGYLCVKRHEQFFTNNKNMEFPVAERCMEDGLHKVFPVEVKGVRNSPWDKSNIVLAAPKLEDHLYCHHVKESSEENDEIEIDIDVTRKTKLSPGEFSDYASKCFKHHKLIKGNSTVFFKHNAEISVVNAESVSNHGLLLFADLFVDRFQSQIWNFFFTTPRDFDSLPILVRPEDLHPALSRIQEMINKGEITESHPFLQEISLFSSMYGNISPDPARGLTDLVTRYMGLMYLQERMRNSSSGKEAHNIYLGRHGVGSQNNVVGNQAVLPSPSSVFHFGLASSSWWKRQVCPVLFDGAIIQFILLLLKILPSVTKTKLSTSQSCVTFAALIFDQKAISPGAELSGGVINGIYPKLYANDLQSLCDDGFSSMLKHLVEKFSSKQWKWIKQVEVFMLQALDICFAAPIATYGLAETGDYEIVGRRVNEVLKYANACSACLDKAAQDGNPPECIVFCDDCFNDRKVCQNHEQIYETWNPDKRPCLSCAKNKSFCNRFKILSTISDMDPSYEKFGKNSSMSFNDVKEQGCFRPFHIHDIGHNIKNAEASLDRGTHFDGQCSYDSTDLAVVFCAAESEEYQNLNGGVSHRAILQFDKQSDELSLQRISGNAIKALQNSKMIVKTDVPELLRPWFSESHDKIGKPFFLTISKLGIVFATDDFSQNVFLYRQSSIPRKIVFIGKAAKENSSPIDPLLSDHVESSNCVWKSVAGICFFKNETIVLVADMTFKTIRVIQGCKAGGQTPITTQSISNYRRLPNMKFCVHSFKVSNVPELTPLALSETSNNLIIVTDPMLNNIHLIDVKDNLKSAVSLLVVTSPLFQRLFDCVMLDNETAAVTDLSKERSIIHIVSLESKEIIHSSTSNSCFPTCVGNMNGDLVVTDYKNHCLYKYNWNTDGFDLLVGTHGISGFQNGALSQATLTSPMGICCRGSTIYVTEHPDDYQGSIRLISNLDGIIEFKSAWQGIAHAFGMISKREKKFLQGQENPVIPRSSTLAEFEERIHPFTDLLEQKIEKMKAINGVQKLDIINGSMSSQTAEAVYGTLMNCIDFMKKYLCYVEGDVLLKLITAKSLTTRLIECFFGHMTLLTQGNNMTFMDIKRKISNEAFTYLLPLINSSSSGVTFRSEKERSEETYSYSVHDMEVDDAALIWKFREEQSKLLTNSKLASLKKSGSTKSGFCFGTEHSCLDFLVLTHNVNPNEIEKANTREIVTALKSRPMRRLRGFSKRRFGTAPTLLGYHAKRATLEGECRALEEILATEALADNYAEEDGDALNIFKPGEMLVFRGSDGYMFNVLLLDTVYTLESVHRNMKIKGNFLIPTADESDPVIFFQDPDWVGGTQTAADLLRDENDTIITVSMELSMTEEGRYFKLQKSIYDEIGRIAINYEDKILAELADDIDESGNLQPQNESFDFNNDILEDNQTHEKDTEEKETFLRKRQRKSRGNKYASVMADLLN